MEIKKYIITKFIPEKIEKELYMYGEILYKPREPSEFEGKTLAIQTSGVLYDEEDVKKHFLDKQKISDLLDKYMSSPSVVFDDERFRKELGL